MVIELQHSIPYTTNIPTDVITNTWHFIFNPLAGVPGPSDFVQLADDVAGYYQGVYPGASGNAAAYCDFSKCRQKIYDLDDPIPRVPKLDRVKNVTVTYDVDPALPTEVAVCCSYEADLVSGIPRASLRGRMYIGGLGDAFNDPGGVGSFPEVAAGARGNLCTNMETYQAFFLTHDWQWVVYSRKLDDTFPVTHGWVDNAFDTQRRRGQSASARTTWTV